MPIIFLVSIYVIYSFFFFIQIQNIIINSVDVDMYEKETDTFEESIHIFHKSLEEMLNNFDSKYPMINEDANNFISKYLFILIFGGSLDRKNEECHFVNVHSKH